MSVSTVPWLPAWIALAFVSGILLIAAVRRYRASRGVQVEDEETRRLRAMLQETSQQAAQAATMAAAAADRTSSLAGLSIGPSLAAIAAILAEAASAPHPPTCLLGNLAGNRLNEGLANLLLIRAYFRPAEAWQLVQVELDRLESGLRSVFGAVGVELDLPEPLTVTSGDRTRTFGCDLRKLGAIPELRRLVLEKAGTLAPGEMLIVDCPMAGWISNSIGNRDATAVVFDPASWTSPS